MLSADLMESAMSLNLICLFKVSATSPAALNPDSGSPNMSSRNWGGAGKTQENIYVS